MRRLASRKTIQNQSLTSSVLNPRSREVWRQTGREREFRTSASVAQSEVFARRPVVIGLLRTLENRRRTLVAVGLAVREGFKLTVRFGVHLTHIESKRIKTRIQVASALRRLPTQKLGWTDAGVGHPEVRLGMEFLVGRRSGCDRGSAETGAE